MKIDHVIFVEDDDEKYDALTRLLRMTNVPVSRAHTFTELCDHMIEHSAHVRLVITDWTFPKEKKGALADACAGEAVVKMARDLGLPYAVYSGLRCPTGFDQPERWYSASQMMELINYVREVMKPFAF